MFLVIELYPPYDEPGIPVDDDGAALRFDSQAEAEAWAKENAAFDYKVVEV